MLADILVRTVDARHEEAQAQRERATERVPIDRATWDDVGSTLT
jgi:hypothetical protein